VSLVIASPEGTITVPTSTLVAIAVAAAERVEGIRVLRRRSVALDERVVRLTVSARRGEPLLELGQAAQTEVTDALRAMCGLETTVELTIGEFA
jgi:hypothetical protein